MIAIPNVVLINNGRSFLSTLLFYMGGVFCFQIFPFIGILFLLGFIFLAESLLFTLSYDFIPLVKNYYIRVIFDNNKEFAHAYTTYFYGNS